MSTVYTVGTIVPFANANRTEGTIVSWDYDLVMTAKYTMRLSNSTGAESSWGMNLRGIDFGGSAIDKVCVVGANTLGVNEYLNSSFILCFDRDTSTGVLTTDWNKIIILNLWNTHTPSTTPGLNPGWEHIAMDENNIYVATRGSRMVISNNASSDNQYTTADPMYAAIAKFRISDGAIMWIKKFTFGSSVGTTNYAKGVTKIALRPNALYAQISVLSTNAGYDYLKINPANGFVTGSSGLSTSVTMPNSSSLGGYDIISGSDYDLTTTYTSGSSDIVTVSETLDATDLYEDIDDQWGINPSSDQYILYSFDSSSVSTSSSVCSATINQKYYFVGTTSSIIVGSEVYSDSLATSGLTNGYYRISSTQYIIVSSGSVSSINTCTTVTSFSSSTGTNVLSVCALSIGSTYYHDGSGTYPAAGDTVYSDSAGTIVLANNYYKFNSTWAYRITGGAGIVEASWPQEIC